MELPHSVLENEIFDFLPEVKTATATATTTTTTTTAATRRPFTARPSTVTPRRQCPREFEQVGADCFHLSDRGAGWIEAKKQCEALGGGLVTLDTASRAAALLDWVGTRT